MKLRNLSAPPSPSPLTPTSLASRLIFGFDRITFFIDLAELPAAIKRLLTKKDNVRSESPRFSPNYKTKISLFQPCTETLIAVATALRGRAQVLIHYAEPAVDYLPRASSAMRTPLAAALAAMHPVKGRQPVVMDDHGTTFYFDRGYIGESRKKQARVRAVYADKPSKLAAAKGWAARPCVHIECRLFGKATLQRAGIVTLFDLIDHDHEAFWRSEALFHRPISAASIGRWRLGASAKDATVQTFSKAGAKWAKSPAICVDSMFCVHNAWLQDGASRFFASQPRFADIAEFWADFERRQDASTKSAAP